MEKAKVKKSDGKAFDRDALVSAIDSCPTFMDLLSAVLSSHHRDSLKNLYEMFSRLIALTDEIVDYSRSSDDDDSSDDENGYALREFEQEYTSTLDSILF